MPSVSPFRALRPTGDVATRLAPPYDVIDTSHRSRLQAASDRNVTHLTLPEGDGSAKYKVAASLLSAWREDGSLIADPAPTLTVYEQRGERTIRGVFAAVGLQEPSAGGVLPHERTYDTIVQDRYDLLDATACNLEPVFLLAYGANGIPAMLEEVTAGTPVIDVLALGVRHLAWRVDDAAQIARVTEALGAATLVIADGHHRWRTAQRYAQSHPDVAEASSHLAFIADAESSGVAIEPIHRVLPQTPAERVFAAAAEVADAEPGPDAPWELAEVVATRRAGGQGRVFGLWSAEGSHLLTMRDPSPLPGDRSAAWRDLDVAVLHETILRDLGPATFAHEPDAAAEAAGAGSAIMVAAPPIGSVRTVAEAGEAMPQKSTLFVPKPASGIVLRPLHVG